MRVAGVWSTHNGQVNLSGRSTPCNWHAVQLTPVLEGWGQCLFLWLTVVLLGMLPLHDQGRGGSTPAETLVLALRLSPVPYPMLPTANAWKLLLLPWHSPAQSS